MRIEKVELAKIRLFLWILVLSFGMIWSVQAATAEVSYNAHGKRDPFIPLVTDAPGVSSGLLGVEEFGDISLEGIVYDPKGSVAIINGSVLKEGDEKESIKVVKIRPDGVLISLNGSEIFKPLYQEEGNKAQSHEAS